MAPEFLLNHHRLNIYAKKLNDSQRTITKLRRSSLRLSYKIKDLSAAMDNRLIEYKPFRLWNCFCFK